MTKWHHWLGREKALQKFGINKDKPLRRIFFFKILFMGTMFFSKLKNQISKVTRNGGIYVVNLLNSFLTIQTEVFTSTVTGHMAKMDRNFNRFHAPTIRDEREK